MQLRDLVPGDEALLHMERYVGEGTQGYSAVSPRNESNPQFQAQSQTAFFDLVTVKVPINRVTVFAAAPAVDLERLYIGREDILFAVHPEIWSDETVPNIGELKAMGRGEPIQVSPTSSTRTVFVRAQSNVVPRHYLKLHLPRLISRFDRRLRRLNIANSVAVTKDLSSFRFHKFAYLPDTLGFTLGHEHSSWGFLVREASQIPRNGSNFLIPCFALYGRDLIFPDDPPLVVQLIGNSGRSPADFVAEEIIIPVIECWTRVVRERGILLESHAQNTLLEVDPQFKPKRIVHRDFDVWIDHEARRKAGLAEIFEGGMEGRSADLMRQHYSLIYDHFLGREFFDYLLTCLRQYYGISERVVRQRAREAFHLNFPDSDEFFPANTTFYFSDSPPPGHEGELVDMKEAPQWR